MNYDVDQSFAADKVAGQAVKLDHYYVSPTCSPTRASLLTGRYAANAGLAQAFVPGSPAGLDPTLPTLPQHLAQLGYTNYLVGKGRLKYDISCWSKSGFRYMWFTPSERILTAL